jgi:hypothetical protein
MLRSIVSTEFRALLSLFNEIVLLVLLIFRVQYINLNYGSSVLGYKSGSILVIILWFKRSIAVIILTVLYLPLNSK